MEGRLDGRKALVMNQLNPGSTVPLLEQAQLPRLQQGPGGGGRPLPSTDNGEFRSAALCKRNLMVGTHWDASGLFMEVVIIKW